MVKTRIKTEMRLILVIAFDDGLENFEPIRSSKKGLCNLKCVKARLTLLRLELLTAQQLEPCFNTAKVMLLFYFLEWRIQTNCITLK